MESNIKGLVAAGHALAEDHQRAIESIKQAD